MREYETVTEEVTRTRCKKMTCDLCGIEGVRAYWESGYYETNDTKVEVTVHAKKGMSYPDGDSWGHEYLVDICPKCFREKLVPWLNSQVQALKKRNTNHDCSMAQNMALIQTRLLR